jgi:hypothetical protein
MRNGSIRRLFIAALWVCWIGVTAYFSWLGRDYYFLGLSQRPMQEVHAVLRPSGSVGHGLGVVGSCLMIVGVVMYSIRKRSRRIAHWGNLRDWLAFHIFLCVTGATLVTFHTAGKFGGLVSISYWSMVGVAVSGFLGRYVYVRIPRDPNGNETAASTLQSESAAIAEEIREAHNLSAQAIERLDAVVIKSLAQGSDSDGLLGMVRTDLRTVFLGWRVRSALSVDTDMSREAKKTIVRLAVRRVSLERSFRFYRLARRILHYWHVIHLPFTVIMFLIMFVHVGVAILFGYRWIL